MNVFCCCIYTVVFLNEYALFEGSMFVQSQCFDCTVNIYVKGNVLNLRFIITATRALEATYVIITICLLHEIYDVPSRIS